MTKSMKLLLNTVMALALLALGYGLATSLPSFAWHAGGADDAADRLNNPPPSVNSSMGSAVNVPGASAKDGAVTPKSAATLNLNPERTILLFTEINYASVDMVVNQIARLEKTSGKIYLLIDSPGGSVFDGLRLLTAIQNAKRPVVTVCYGICASMAATTFEYGAERLISDRATLMFHDAFGGLRGNIANMKAELDYIDRTLGKVDAYIAKRSGKDLPQYLADVQKNVWVDGNDAVAMGYADGTVAVHIDFEAFAGNGVSAPSDGQDSDSGNMGNGGDGFVNTSTAKEKVELLREFR